MVKRFQRSSQVSFPLINPHTMPLGLGILCKACLLFFKIFCGDLLFDVLIIGLFRYTYLWARLMEK